jgi:Kdo2-lipid IVA lauroyltransferase/acyltransferase
LNIMSLLAGAAFAAVSRALALLSLERQRRTGRVLATLAWLLNTRQARSTITNLQLCFPQMDPDARMRLARASLEQTGELLSEVGIVAHWHEPRWRSLIRHVEGDALLDEAERSGDRVLVLIPHFGNWEFLCLYLGNRGAFFLYDPPRLKGLEPAILAARTRSGATLLPIRLGGLRKFSRALRDGRLAALLPDQVPEREGGVYAPFFGQPTLTMTFAHRLIRSSNPRVLLGSAIRCPDGFRIQLNLAPEDIADPDPVVSATAMNRAIEALILAAPAQYQWEYKRFKRPPPGHPNPYPGA